jgi:hypothetical protein
VQVFYPFHPLHEAVLQVVRRPKRGDGVCRRDDHGAGYLSSESPLSLIGKENAVVRMDQRVRTELIDLMARILVTVFELKEGKLMNQFLCNPKIKPEHLARKAIVYLRQSSEKQVRHNKESQRLQYDVAERMRS